MAAAATLVRAGCLDCLIEALREYQALRRVPAVAVEATAGAARTATLVAIRERELGLEDSGAADPGAPAGGIVKPELSRARRWTARCVTDRAIRGLPSTARTTAPRMMSIATLNDRMPGWRDTSLIRFRIATCTAFRTAALKELLEGDPRFLEITYYMGLDAMIQGDLDGADAQFERAYNWRPRWARVANTRGTVFMTAEEFERAAGVLRPRAGGGS